MSSNDVDSGFVGSIPQIYDRYMVPLMFEVYAQDLARRVAHCRPSRVLEIAAGTGVLTRELAKVLPAAVSLVASDLNQPMLDHAAAMGTGRVVDWRQADVMNLPFPDRAFDLVACQFGVMFFPDRARAYAEVRRTLQPGGCFVFSVWDRIEDNTFANTVSQALRRLFPDDPPRFMERVPHGYFDVSVITQDLARGGFDQPPQFDTLQALSRAASPRIPAVALCQGTPLRIEIEAKGGSRLEEATDVATAILAQRHGRGPVEGRLQARIVTVRR